MRASAPSPVWMAAKAAMPWASGWTSRNSSSTKAHEVADRHLARRDADAAHAEDREERALHGDRGHRPQDGLQPCQAQPAVKAPVAERPRSRPRASSAPAARMVRTPPSERSTRRS